MIIRAAKTKDASVLSNLLEQLGYPTSVSSCREKIKAYTKKGYKMLMAEVDRSVTGFISLHWYDTPHQSGSIGRITAFCVNEQSRTKGYGTQLLTAAEQHFKNLYCYKIEVTSNLRRTQTQQYYKNMGYGETSKHFVKFLKKD